MCAVITDAGITLLVARDARRVTSEAQVMAVLRLPVLSAAPADALADRGWAWGPGANEVTVFTAHITAIIGLVGDPP